MNKFIVLLAIVSACGAESTALPPDAAQLPVDAAMPADAARPMDAAIDTPAPEPESRGCMGNLPISRTITINTGDAVPPNLLNELQDVAVGAKRGQFTRRWQPCTYFSASPTFWSMAQNPSGVPTQFQPVLKAASATVVSAYFPIPYEEGETVVGWNVSWYGDGVITPAIQMLYSSSIGTAASSPSIISLPTPVPAAWTTLSPLSSLSPQSLAPGSSLYFVVTTSSISTANNYLGPVSVSFTHP